MGKSLEVVQKLRTEQYEDEKQRIQKIHCFLKCRRWNKNVYRYRWYRNDKWCRNGVKQ